MRRAAMIVASALLLGMMGCKAFQSIPDNPLPDQPNVPFGSMAWVYVDGRESGATPTTVQVRRGFGETTVAVVSGEQTQRIYEVERVYTSNRSDLEYSFGANSGMNIRTFDSEELNRDDDGRYMVPYYAQPIAIEDRHFGLTLIVTE